MNSVNSEVRARVWTQSLLLERRLVKPLGHCGFEVETSSGYTRQDFFASYDHNHPRPPLGLGVPHKPVKS